MDLNYRYSQSDQMAKWLKKIEANKNRFDQLPNKEAIELRFQRESLLKSAVYSAKIEGNRLSFDEAAGSVGHGHDVSRERLEISNLYRAYRKLYDSPSDWNISLETIKHWHRLVMDGISGDAGQLRHEQSAVFNQAGVAIFVPPPAQELEDLLNELVEIIEESVEPIPIVAALAHFGFEKVHPFLDGNGRVGRLLSHRVLMDGGYDFRGMLVLEDYINQQRREYYDVLLPNKKDVTGFVEYWLEAMVEQSELVLKMSAQTKTLSDEDYLLPRRSEILALIRDHRVVSFDFIRRRFLAVSEGTLHHDVRYLMDKGFVIKRGSTRGAVYSPK